MTSPKTAGADDLAAVYRDLHQHPELSFADTRTAAVVANRLRGIGFDTTGVLRNGPGPAVLLRADMDALPMAERTGLSYASVASGVDAGGNEVPVAHSCGHDVHVACLLGAAQRLAEAQSSWRGTVVTVFQPAEELGRGAQAMIDDGPPCIGTAARTVTISRGSPGRSGNRPGGAGDGCLEPRSS